MGLVSELEEGRDGLRTETTQGYKGSWCVCVPQRQAITDAYTRVGVGADSLRLLNEASFEVAGQKWTMVEAQAAFNKDLTVARAVYERAIEKAKEWEPIRVPKAITPEVFAAQVKEDLAALPVAQPPAALPAPTLATPLEEQVGLWSRAVPARELAKVN